MRAVVLSDGRVDGGELVLNAEFLRVAAHWWFHPREVPAVSGADEGQGGAADPLHPRSFFYSGVRDDEASSASRWLEGTANVRRTPRRTAPGMDRFERDEREALGPLARRYQILASSPPPSRPAGA